MLELNKIHKIDVLDGLRQLDSESIDLFIFSPPYNLRNKNGKAKNLTGCGKWIMKNVDLSDGYDNHDDALKHEDYVEWQKTILSECWRCLKNTGAIFYNHKPIIRNRSVILPTQYIPQNLNLRQVIIWKRSGGLNFNPKFYLPVHEWIMLFAKPEFELKSRGAAGIKDVWEFSQEKNTGHPAPFPLQLPRKILETVKYKDLVVDPFMGSGTTAKACREFGSNFIGFENSQKYIDMANERLKKC